MAYTVERKVNGNIYPCEAESYWDKDKKHIMQRSKYDYLRKSANFRLQI
jgi:hypothetical protein